MAHARSCEMQSNEEQAITEASMNKTLEKTEAAKPKRPGYKQGLTGELTTFWNVKKGHEKQLRQVLEGLNQWPMEERAYAGRRIGTLHERRWVLFDNDTRMLFCTSYDGEWDPYIEAFAEHNAKAFDVIFAHIEGWPSAGLKDPGIFDYIVAHQVTATEYMRFYDGTVKEIQNALKLQKAFNKLIDTQEFREAISNPALKPLLETPEFKAVLDHAAG
jgi:hypothetical protein